MKRGKLRSAILILAASILLSSCGKPQEEEVELPVIEEIDPKEETHNIELSDYEIELLRQEKLTEEYADYFANYPVLYNQISYYLQDSQVDQLIAASNIETHCTRNFELDPDLFFDVLKENSEKFVSEHSEYRIPFAEEGYYVEHANSFESNLRYTLDTIINGKNDIYDDLHQVEQLTIVFGNASKFYHQDDIGDTRCYLNEVDVNSSNEERKVYLVYATEDDSIILGAYDSTNNIMVIDDEAIMLITSMYYELEEQYQKFDELLLETILHEFNHVRQKACPCRIEQGLTLNNMFVYDDNYISTISESAAESELYNLGKYPHSYSMNFGDYTYESERVDELLLMSLALCNDEAKIEDYYNAIADTNYAALYNFYDLRSREEIYDFYHIVYSIDSKNYRNDLWSKIYTEEELEEKTQLDYAKDIGYAYRVDIFRMVLEKLTRYTNEKGHHIFSLRDNLAVFNILKSIVIKDAYMYYEDDTNPEMVRYRKYYDEYMVENIVYLENRYIDFLSEFYGVSVSEIRALETSEIPEYVETIINVANYDYHDVPDEDDASKLFSNMPILQSLLKKRYISFYDYQDFIEDNEEIIFAR